MLLQCLPSTHTFYNQSQQAIQHEVIKHLEGQCKELYSAMDGLDAYFTQRGGAAEKVLARSSTDEKSTKTTSKSVGGKDGSEEKESTTTVHETAKKLADPLFDQVDDRSCFNWMCPWYCASSITTQNPQPP